MYHVYVLVDPDAPDEVRYVGITNNLNKRLTQHIYSSKTYPNGTKKENWIGKLLSEGRKPLLIPMDSAPTEQEVFELEMDLIRVFNKADHNLTNGTSDPEARKVSSSHAKRGWDALTPEQRRDRIIKGRLGTNLSWAKKHGRVLSLTPKHCTCKEST